MVLSDGTNSHQLQENADSIADDATHNPLGSARSTGDDTLQSLEKGEISTLSKEVAVLEAKLNGMRDKVRDEIEKDKSSVAKANAAANQAELKNLEKAEV